MELDRIIAVRNDKTVYRDGMNCVKVFDCDYAKSDVLNEALNQARVEKSGLNIPKISEVCKINGMWAITLDFIPGKTLEAMIEKNPEKATEYLELFVNLQLEVHSKSVADMNYQRDKLNRAISQSQLDATTRYELHARLDAMPRHNKLCHGDFNPSNIILTDDGTPYILDWSHATQGNASADAARTYLWLKYRGDANAEKYLAMFCERTDTARQYVLKWLPIVAAAQSVKCGGSEREYLLSWVSVTE